MEVPASENLRNRHGHQIALCASLGTACSFVTCDCIDKAGISSHSVVTLRALSMGRKTIRKSGKPYTGAERMRRSRAEKKHGAKEQDKLERTARRYQVAEKLDIKRLAIDQVDERHLASSSVDAVISDPPYARADLPLYGSLAKFAMRVLKPGGWCIAMTGY
jgi:hypothetical protein